MIRSIEELSGLGSVPVKVILTPDEARKFRYLSDQCAAALHSTGLELVSRNGTRLLVRPNPEDLQSASEQARPGTLDDTLRELTSVRVRSALSGIEL